MIPIGYMYKTVADRPAWLKVEGVSDIYSLSNCTSHNFADYFKYWKHNGYWLFNSPGAMEDIANQENIDLSGATLFYYEAYEYEYDEDAKEWSAFTPEPSFVTEVQVPIDKHLEGFDVTTFTSGTDPECSPLSCNSLAKIIPVNRHCLLNDFATAKTSLEEGLFQHSEPGPFRIIAVYTLGGGL